MRITDDDLAALTARWRKELLDQATEDFAAELARAESRADLRRRVTDWKARYKLQGEV